MAKKKDGKALEELVGWIQHNVHAHARVTVDEEIPDVDSGESRQVDLTIRFKDGPTELLAIVEVRDRKEPVGSRYIEEVATKRSSVGADAVYVVSSSGFTAPALVKAKRLGIRAMTLSEAKADDWSSWIGLRNISMIERKFRAIGVQLYGEPDNCEVTLHDDVIRAIHASPAFLAFTDFAGNGLIDLPRVIHQVINHFGEKPYSGLPEDGTKRRIAFTHRTGIEPALHVRDALGSHVRLRGITIVADIWWEVTEHPVRLLRFGQHGRDGSIAEIAQADLPHEDKQLRFELLAETTGEYIEGGKRVVVRTRVIE